MKTMLLERTAAVFLTAVLLFFCHTGYAENIDPHNDGSQYVWGENVGWLNLEPGGNGGPGVEVGDSILTGYIWGENIGWINMNPADGGVINDGTGNLSGYAWGENVGWINFAPPNGGVYIDACGNFNGTAWGENIGWIVFDSSLENGFRATTTWISPVDEIAPVTKPQAPPAEWYQANVSITLSADDCGSGVSKVHYGVDGGAEVSTSGSTAAVTITTEGEHTLTYYSVDRAGNIETINEATIRVDKTPPDIDIVSPGDGAIYQINVPLTADFTVTDSYSGVATTTASAGQGDRIGTGTPGAYTFSVSATDKAGNHSSITHHFTVSFPGNIDPESNGSQYVYGENVGWINLKPSFGPGVTVTDSEVRGYAWGQNIGWINLSPSGGGVANDGKGHLSGYAWGENVGWIKFAPTGGGVAINPVTGEFSGYAWGENIGWINFGQTAGHAKTSWRGATDSDGDGVPDSEDPCPNDPGKVAPGTCGCGVADTDTDGDGIPDCIDNCPSVSNPGQEDRDGNGIGNACDVIPGDLDHDGDVDRNDVTIINAHRNQPASACPECDIDGDGTITVLDARKLTLMCTCAKCGCP